MVDLSVYTNHRMGDMYYNMLYKPNTGTRRYVFYIANTGLLRPKNLRIANTGYLIPKISGDVKIVKL